MIEMKKVTQMFVLKRKNYPNFFKLSNCIPWRLEDDADACAEVVHEAGGVVDEVDGGGVGVDADKGALVEAPPHLQQQ